MTLPPRTPAQTLEVMRLINNPVITRAEKTAVLLTLGGAARCAKLLRVLPCLTARREAQMTHYSLTPTAY